MTASALVTWRVTCRRRGCLAAAFVDGRPVTSARTLAISLDAAFAELAAVGWQQAGRGQLCPAHRRPVSLVKRQPAVVVPLPVKKETNDKAHAASAVATVTAAAAQGARARQEGLADAAPEPVHGRAGGAPAPRAQGAGRPLIMPRPAVRLSGPGQPKLPIGGTVRDGIAGLLPAAASRRESWSLFPRRNSGTASAHTRGGPALMVRAQAAEQSGSNTTTAHGLHVPGRAMVRGEIPRPAPLEPDETARPGPLARAVAWLRPGRWWPWRRKKGRHAAEFETHPVPAERWSA